MNFLFGFTGDGRMSGDPALGQLPQNWVIEWDRWIKTDPAHPTRSARKIDTELAPPLADMVNQGNDPALGRIRASCSSTWRGGTCAAATG